MPSSDASGGDRPPRVRLFVGLEPCDAARAALAEGIARTLGGRAELRPTPSESLHVTLVFLGWRPEGQVADIGAAALAGADELAAAELGPRALVDVPRGRPRLVALDLADPSGRAAAVQAASEAALVAAALHEPERRPFWPHVTLARVRRGRRRRAPVDRVTSAAWPFAEPLTFDRVTLLRSHLSRDGARYEPLESRVLNPATEAG